MLVKDGDGDADYASRRRPAARRGQQNLASLHLSARLIGARLDLRHDGEMMTRSAACVRWRRAARLAQPFRPPVTMVVPFGAGGPTDALARIVAERMRCAGAEVLVENVTGAPTSASPRRARGADGYTLCSATGSFVVAARSTRTALRRHQGFRADRAASEQSLHRGQQEGSAGEGFEGADRLHQGEPGQALRRAPAVPARASMSAASISRK
jgi:hypothetical protein